VSELGVCVAVVVGVLVFVLVIGIILWAIGLEVRVRERGAELLAHLEKVERSGLCHRAQHGNCESAWWCQTCLACREHHDERLCRIARLIRRQQAEPPRSGPFGLPRKYVV